MHGLRLHDQKCQKVCTAYGYMTRNVRRYARLSRLHDQKCQKVCTAYGYMPRNVRRYARLTATWPEMSEGMYGFRGYMTRNVRRYVRLTATCPEMSEGMYGLRLHAQKCQKVCTAFGYMTRNVRRYARLTATWPEMSKVCTAYGYMTRNVRRYARLTATWPEMSEGMHGFRGYMALKVDSNEKRGGSGSYSNRWAQVWDHGDRGLFSIWTCRFSIKILFPFPFIDYCHNAQSEANMFLSLSYNCANY
jgi:hypothetical protein